jgi:hypothetical protein
VRHISTECTHTSYSVKGKQSEPTFPAPRHTKVMFTLRQVNVLPSLGAKGSSWESRVLSFREKFLPESVPAPISTSFSFGDDMLTVDAANCEGKLWRRMESYDALSSEVGTVWNSTPGSGVGLVVPNDVFSEHLTSYGRSTDTWILNKSRSTIRTGHEK